MLELYTFKSRLFKLNTLFKLKQKQYKTPSHMKIICMNVRRVNYKTDYGLCRGIGIFLHLLNSHL